MIDARRIVLDIWYNALPFKAQIGAEVESMTYVDSGSNNSDSVDITISALDKKWLGEWMPEKGASISPYILGRNWEDGETEERRLACGLFILDDISYSDAPATLSIGAVAKPANENFSELERKKIWKNTSIRRIGEEIAKHYDLGFSYDAEDYDIDCDEQDGTDSSYFNDICKRYGLILKVYAGRVWVFDRERYKEKPPVKNFDRTDIRPGSFQYSTTLSGTYTGGKFSYTDAKKNIDISCSVGGGTHTKNVSRKASSTKDACVQLCAEINNANHSQTTIKFSVEGQWTLSAGNCITVTGYGQDIHSGLNGKYYVDKITHKYSSGSGFTSDIECSKIEGAYYPWGVGGNIEYRRQDGLGVDEKEATNEAKNAESEAKGATAGSSVNLKDASFYVSSTATTAASKKTGTYYFYDGQLVNGRYRMTNTAERCGKQPAGKNVTGWVSAVDCGL